MGIIVCIQISSFTCVMEKLDTKINWEKEKRKKEKKYMDNLHFNFTYFSKT